MNKLGVVVFSLAIVAVLAIVLSVTLTADRNRNNDNEPFVADGDPITFEEFITSKFSPSYFNGSWWSSRELQWRDEANNLVVWNVETEETSLLVSSDTVGLVSSSATFIAFGGQTKSLLLFKDQVESVWRHSFLAQYFVLDVTKNETLALTPNNHPDGTKLQYAQWVPQTDKVVYVFDNNIYIRDILGNGEDEQITSDGVIDTVYNGIPDWVYEEEILSTNKAMYFTDSGSKLAYAKFNDQDVQEFYYTKYGSPEDPYKVQYPQEIMLKYPKVGTANPTVSLWVSDLKAPNQVVPVTPPRDVAEGHLYTAAKWVSEDVLSIIWTNRVQNESSVSICKESSTEWLCETVTSPVQHNGWLDVFQPPFYKSDGKSFLQILPQKLPGKELHYNHIKLHHPQTQEDYFITNGEFVVISILHWDEENSKVYFMGTGEREAGARQLYWAQTDGQVLIQCITCQLRTSRGDLCQYNQVSFSNDASYYIHTCLGPNIPEVVLRSNVNDDDQAVKYVFETNQQLEEQLSSKALSEKMDLKVTVGGDDQGFQAPVLLKLPKGYDPVNDKYPLLVYVYGGPESQIVDQRWKLGYEDYLTSNYGVVYAMIDGRGTGFQSNEYKFEVYHQLGTVEMLDQISVTKELLRRFPFLDENRTGIWGWSYGGYATAMTLIKDTENVFQCGLSTAPPTNWLFYDSFYTERYMGLPTVEDNMAGYNASSLLDKVDKLKGKKFQLNHGVADDNVHYQQSMLFIRALELEDIAFEQHSYPDENHSLRGVKSAVYHNFNQFWTQCFNL